MKREKGFTLVEILVALTILMLIGGAALNILLSSIRSQRDALGNQDLVDQISFVAEYMSRAIRQAEKDLDNDCLENLPIDNYEVHNGGRTMRFLDKGNICREFVFDSTTNTVRERWSVNDVANFTSDVPLTSDEITVQDMQFSLEGEDQLDNTQPRVTFFIDAESIQLQTTISQRRFDVVE